MALPLIEIERELARKRKHAGKPLKDLYQNFEQGGRTLEIIAERIGVSDELIRQTLYVMQHTSEKDLEKLRSGKKKISNLYREVKNSMTKEEEPMNRAAAFLTKLLRPPKRKDLLKINKYGNTRFMLLTLDKSFFEEFERDSLELEVPPELSAMKALEENHVKIKKGIALKTKLRFDNDDFSIVF